jgi:chromosome segregation ATPase
MTNAIEQTKITMYDAFNAMKAGGRWLIKKENCEAFESALEEHLEGLRLELERWKLSDKKTGEMIQFKQAEQKREREQHEETQRQLHRMTQERDDIQGRLHAVDHAFSEQGSLVWRQGEEISRHKIALNIAGEELIRAQGVARQHLDDCRSAEKLSDSLDEKLRDAQSVIAHQEQLIVGQRLAIADLYMRRSGFKSPTSRVSHKKCVCPNPGNIAIGLSDPHNRYCCACYGIVE